MLNSTEVRFWNEKATSVSIFSEDFYLGLKRNQQLLPAPVGGGGAMDSATFIKLALTERHELGNRGERSGSE